MNADQRTGWAMVRAQHGTWAHPESKVSCHATCRPLIPLQGQNAKGKPAPRSRHAAATELMGHCVVLAVLLFGQPGGGLSRLVGNRTGERGEKVSWVVCVMDGGMVYMAQEQGHGQHRE